MTFQDPKIQGRIRSCNKCSASIIWLRTHNYKSIAINAGTVLLSETLYDPVVGHVPHFITCKGKHK